METQKDQKDKMDEDTGLLNALSEYCGQDYYPFHMPGHKRRLGSMPDPFSIDITEIEGFDNLHSACGILKRAQQRAAGLYHAAESFFLVNGSTAGILSAVGACAHRGRGRKILIARNSHRSAYHAVYLNELEPVYLYPEPFRYGNTGPAFSEINGKIRPESVENALSEHEDICCVFITSPTYDGVISDIEKIAAAAHRYDLPLIVDEAHGAHFGLHPAFPASAVTLGADLVIQSLHKTLPSLTQTALLHICSDRADPVMLKRMLQIYQSSSPSYVLMASADQCVRFMEKNKERYLEDLYCMLDRFYRSVSDLKVLEIIRTDDPSRILIGNGSSGLSGLQICDILREEYHLETEMSAPGYVLALTSVGDDEEGLFRLSEALREIDAELDLHRHFSQHPLPERLRKAVEECGRISVQEVSPQENTVSYLSCRPQKYLTIREAWDMPKERKPTEDCAGLICGEFICLYPPGIPLLVPGEMIGEDMLHLLKQLKAKGYSFAGCNEMHLENLFVCRNNQLSRGVPRL